MKRFCLIVALCGYITGSAQAQQNFDNVQIKPQHVNGKVHMLEGSGGNIGVSVGDDGLLIVDDQYAPLADKIKAALKGLSAGNLKFLLNTHHHGDHTGGNAIFGEQATIVAHDNVRKRLSTGDNPLAKSGWPVITFDQSISVHFNGETIRLMHYGQGHTDGDAIIYFTESNVVHMGDTFFNGRFPFVDLSSNGRVSGLIDVIDTVLSRLPPDAKIIPGHGAIGTRDDLRTYYAMLQETTDHVRQQMKAGKTLDAIKAAGLPEKYKDWGAGFVSADRWIETIYNSYSNM